MMKKNYLTLLLGMIFFIGIIGSVSATWNYVGNLSDNFSDGLLNNTLWNATGTVIEYIGGITASGGVGGMNYVSLNYNFNTSSTWRIDFNFSYNSAGELFIFICNKSADLTWSDFGNFGTCLNPAPFPYYANPTSGSLPEKEFYLIINSTDRGIILYNWDGSINKTSTGTNELGNYIDNLYLGFGRGHSGSAVVYLNTSFRVYQFSGTTPDVTSPNLIITYPTNNTNSSNNKLNINYTVSDSVGLSSCWYSNDSYSSNTTLPSCANISNANGITWVDGYHNVTIWANDTSNNLNWSSVSFTIDATPPNLTINSPMTIRDSLIVNINITAWDLNGLSYCYFNITKNGILQVLNTNISNCANITSAVSSYGNYLIYVSVNDTFGNVNMTSQTFSVDTSAGGTSGSGATIYQAENVTGNETKQIVEQKNKLQELGLFEWFIIIVGIFALIFFISNLVGNLFHEKKRR